MKFLRDDSIPAGTPFRRAYILARAIRAAEAIPDVGKRVEALRALPKYISRGKGSKTPVMTRQVFNKCNNGKSGTPHQSSRECARRWVPNWEIRRLSQAFKVADENKA